MVRARLEGVSREINYAESGVAPPHTFWRHHPSSERYFTRCEVI